MATKEELFRMSHDPQVGDSFTLLFSGGVGRVTITITDITDTQLTGTYVCEAVNKTIENMRIPRFLVEVLERPTTEHPGYGYFTVEVTGED